MLTIHNLSHRFGKLKALDSITLEMKPGVIGLLGPNGAGKTTLIRYLTGIYPDKNDTIQLNGQPIDGDKKPLIGYLPQSFGVFPYMTTEDTLKFLADFKEVEKNQEEEVQNCLTAVGLLDKRSAKGKSLSGGMVRRVGIAQALLGNPSLVVYDEPTAGLDPEERLRFKNILARQTEGIHILATHIVEDIEAICHQIIVLNQGKLLFYGNQNELAAIAQGFVYEDDESAIANQHDVHIIRRVQSDGPAKVRYLSANRQKNAVNPTIEDGYLYLLHQEKLNR